MRDGLYCTHGQWIVVYWSDHVLRLKSALNRQTRLVLDAGSAIAIFRLKELMARKKRRHDEKELSPRELAVLRHLGCGRTLAAVAEQLDLSENTSREYLRRAQKKLKAKNALQAAVVAARLRLI